MAEASTLPARKRAVPAARPKRASAVKTTPTPTSTPTRTRRAPVVIEEPATPNYALRMMDAFEDEPVAAPVDDTFASSLSKALEAINARASDVPAEEPQAAARTNWLQALDKLPPIKLPVGPAIPWRFGLPLLAGLVIVMAVMSRSAGQADPGVQLPAQQTYPVQQESPLFAKPEATSVAVDQQQQQVQQAAAPQQQQPIGVSDGAAMNFDLMDIGIKLIAVLALAYGSMLALKRLGLGGARPGSRPAGNAVQVVSSIALAPNRSVHVIRVPGGKALLVGATPNAVNLLADLGELAEDETPEAASFLDAFKAKLPV